MEKLKERIIAHTSLTGDGEGGVWSVSGTRSGCGVLFRTLMADDRLRGKLALLDFAQQSEAARAAGWLQARYYDDACTMSVEEYLSYNAVYGINPFEVGRRIKETKKAFNERMKRIVRLLEVRQMFDKALASLSNGETRRVLMARALATGAKVLLLNDPAAGLDSRQRTRLKDILSALAKRGIVMLAACTHADELPRETSLQIQVSGDGAVKIGRFEAPEGCAEHVKPPAARQGRACKAHAAPAVLEIAGLNVAYGKQRLFENFSWRVSRGERWRIAGENGAGKTTLFAIITGDSPLAYAADVKVFGIARSSGSRLDDVRKRIALVSPELQAWTGLSPHELLSGALSSGADLILLDEPFMNMAADEAKAASDKIARFLRRHKRVTALLICHRDDEVPDVFDQTLCLPVRTNPGESNKG